MIKFSTVFLAMAGAGGMAYASAFSACPAVGADALEGCQLLITVTGVTAGVATSFFVTLNPLNLGAFDRSDDTLVGIQNATSFVMNSISLANPGSGIAGFEGDGACAGFGTVPTYNPAPTLAQCGLVAYTTTNPQNYESAGVTFSAFSNPDDVTITFTGGLPPDVAGTCGSAWFSLENTPTPGSFGGGTSGTTCSSIGPGGTPEPGSLVLLGSGLAWLAFFARRRRA